MAQPKKQSSPRKTGMRRSHLVEKLAKRVNGHSPVKVLIGKKNHQPSRNNRFEQKR